MMDSRVEFVACDNPHATRLTLHILAAIAEHEREMISARTKATLHAAKARGVRLGRNGERLASANRATAVDRARQIEHVLAELNREGKSVRQVKMLLGISHGEAGRLRLRAAAGRGFERRPSVPNPRSRHLGTPKATGAACDEARCHVFAVLDAKSSTS
jgi:DNA invertase Pin-like site-specific DNA recombinase